MFSERTTWKLTQNRFTQALEEVRNSGRQILDLTISNPTRIGLKYDESAILSTLSSTRIFDYDPQAKGMASARDAVVRYYGEAHHTEVDPERVILTTSTSEGYSYVFRLLCNAGDELLVPKPSYPLFEFLADLHDVKLVPYPLIYDHGWQIDLHSLGQGCSSRTRGIVLVHPNNPTGSYVHPSETESLNAFCRERRLALIVDEVFLDYALDGRPHTTFAANTGALTFVLSGISKISALPQMKVAWVAVSGPEESVDSAMARLEVVADTYLSMNAPIQCAAATLLDQRTSVQKQITARVQRNLAELDHQLAFQKGCERLQVEGGWYAVLRVPVTESDEELAIRLLRDKSVLVHPGHFYDFAQDGYLILSLITPEAELAQGLRLILGCVAD